MKIAVVGAGYAGLSLCWHLLQIPGVSVSLFDSRGVGGGASGVSTGLLHPYPAKNANRSAKADEAMQESTLLIGCAERALGKAVALHTGVLRLAMTPELRGEFATRSGDVEFWQEERVSREFPEIQNFAGLWIEQGKTVFSRLYLEGLWADCQRQGAKLICEEISQLEQLSQYDGCALANGYEALRFNECAHLPLKTKKGQTLVCRWPKEWPRLISSVIGSGHISPMEDPSLCQLGSTYEENFSAAAAHGLSEKIGAFFPPARSFEVVEVGAGVRIAPKTGYLPLIEKIAPKAWIFTGLGSRGLLYHGLYGKELAQNIHSELIG